MLENGDERVAEAAILGLGAISDGDGCYYAIEEHLEKLVPYLMLKLDG